MGGLDGPLSGVGEDFPVTDSPHSSISYLSLDWDPYNIDSGLVLTDPSDPMMN
jgi:hypothetical protein